MSWLALSEKLFQEPQPLAAGSCSDVCRSNFREWKVFIEAKLKETKPDQATLSNDLPRSLGAETEGQAGQLNGRNLSGNIQCQTRLSNILEGIQPYL